MTNARVMIIGPMGSGKTTVADHLVKNHGYQKRTLAAAIKNIVADIEDGCRTDDIITKRILKYISLSDFEYKNMVTAIEMTKSIEHEIPKPRKRLQFLGTEGGRQMVRDSIWIDIIRATLWPGNKYVIDDVRFLNEYKAFLKANFTPIKLVLSPETQHTRLSNLYGNYDPKILTHPSETEIASITIDPKFKINSEGPKDNVLYYVNLVLGIS